MESDSAKVSGMNLPNKDRNSSRTAKEGKGCGWMTSASQHEISAEDEQQRGGYSPPKGRPGRQGSALSAADKVSLT